MTSYDISTPHHDRNTSIIFLLANFVLLHQSVMLDG